MIVDTLQTKPVLCILCTAAAAAVVTYNSHYRGTTAHKQALPPGSHITNSSCKWEQGKGGAVAYFVLEVSIISYLQVRIEGSRSVYETAH